MNTNLILKTVLTLTFLAGSVGVCVAGSDVDKLIAHSRSAAPTAVSDDATVVVNGEVVAKGSNGWTCMPEVMAGDGAAVCIDAMWGEMMAIAGTVKGLGGAVVDGGVRDVLAIREMKFPMFYRNPVVTTAQTRLDTISVNDPIQCGGRLVCPGDLVFGDYDGITVVPRDSIDKIYPLCLEYFDTEKKQRTALKQGMRLSQLKEDIL